jgi:hypothetical protein
VVGVISPAACARRELAKGVCGGGVGHRKALGAEQIVHHAATGPALTGVSVVVVGVLVVVGVAWRRGVGGGQMESLHAHLWLIGRRGGIVEGHLDPKCQGSPPDSRRKERTIGYD